MLNQSIWTLKHASNPINLDEEKLLEILFKNRNLTSKSEIEDFLNPSLEKLKQMDFEDMPKTLSRIESAIKNKEKIIVYSDYDADGISAAAILWETLSVLNANVLPYIPNRLTEGYGFSKDAITKLSKQGVSLIISVDHGITAKAEIAHATQLGIDVILTDHHLPPDDLPEPFAKIHTTQICGAGVSWKLSYELHNYFDLKKESIHEKLSIAAIATIADQMPLTNHNRALVKHGLEYLRLTTRPGLIELYNLAGIDRQSIDEYHLGHIIAPRINAMGRLDHAIDSLRLYCTKSNSQAKELSKILEDTNIKRKELTESGVIEAYKQVADTDNLIVLDSTDWHEGIIGLIAGRINDAYHKPTIIISVGEKFSKGSARSVDGVDVTKLLRYSSDLLEDVGGHPMAAGFTIPTKNIAKFKSQIKSSFETYYSNKIFPKQIVIETEILPHHINMSFYSQMSKLKPFGNNNPEPLFLMRKQKIISLRRVGSDQSHLKVDFENHSSIGFRLAEKASGIRPGNEVDIIFTLNINEFNGRKSLQLVLKDIAVTGDQRIQRT